MPECVCDEQNFYVFGFHVEPDLRHLEVIYRCLTCGREARTTYKEHETELKERDLRSN